MIISDQFLEEYIKKELIRKEQIGFDQIEKTLSAGVERYKSLRKKFTDR